MGNKPHESVYSENIKVNGHTLQGNCSIFIFVGFSYSNLLIRREFAPLGEIIVLIQL